MKGFFSSTPTLRQSLPIAAQCHLCKLDKGCLSPKMQVNGRGERKILIVGEAPGCIGGDSLIDTAFRDKTKFPNGIPIRDLVGKEGFFVYSFNVEKQELVLGRVNKVWKTGTKKVYKVTYEWKYADKEKVFYLQDSILVTKNHKFLLKRKVSHDPFKGIEDGRDYVSIEQGLSIGHSLQPFLRFNGEYSLVGAFSNKRIKESRMLLEHKLGRKLEKGEECHHSDENKLNDKRKNLILHTKESHARYHTQKINPMDRPGVKEKHSKVMRSEEYRSRMSEKMKKVRNQDPVSFYNSLLKRHCKGEITKEYIETRFKEIFPSETFPPCDNHKVISIEYVGIKDVYDMEVEEHHNFAVNGIFVHNSNEDKRNLPFIGKTGKLLSETLAKSGIKMRRDCWIINSARCRPEKNALPEKSIDYCRPNVINDIKELNPEVIILLGGAAVKSVLGWLFKPESGGITKWAGWQVPCQKINTWICPAWHPSYVSRGEKNEQVVKLLWKHHLEAAVSLVGRPWGKVPDWESQARIEMDVRKVPDWIDRLMSSGKPLAWDIETDRLNPDSPDATIVCCSISDGDISVSYPWSGEAIEATREFIKSDVPKIGFSIKYETKWARKVLKCTPRNWKWDGQLAAHVLDNRPGICSLEFQEFAVLGFPEHKSKIKPYLEGEGSNGRNRIHELPIERVLKYNSLDSLIEWKVAEKQMQQIGVKI